MIHTTIVASPHLVAEEAARRTAEALGDAVRSRGEATWVLAGGTSPMAAYDILAKTYANALDWSKVTVLMGDERCVPLTHPDSNWGQIQGFLDALGIADENRLVPPVELGPDAAADAYEQAVFQIARFDVVWLGMGEDGHTLSLFPGHGVPDVRLVCAVHDSPKPPAQRITLTFEALKKAGVCLILVAGTGKATTVADALAKGSTLPVARAATMVDEAGGAVVWLLDEAAAGKQR
ncbi:MAG TPA: 6-phosphogluconolactonase [Candidatus Saccharimonadales bacterium]|nr:6-phosphogluconolactonase [Candidatus Saccharimonadales bacterium]